MKFGYFDDVRREYCITTPETPLPWINYLGNDGFFGLISNTAGGYCFYRDAKLRRITRYRYNDIPNDIGGRLYYIKDGNTVFIYEGHKLLIPLQETSPITIHHIGKGTVKLSFRFIEVLGKIESP